MSERNLFGTDGIREKVGVWPLTPEGAEQVGLAVGAELAGPDNMVVLAWDPRESSSMLADAMAEGLTASGTDVRMVPAPTPALAHATRQSEAAAGVMITASHNPHTYNGYKVFTTEGEKLSDGEEATLNSRIHTKIPVSQRTGRRFSGMPLLSAYKDYVVDTAGVDLDGLRIGLDMANGATSGVATSVFERLGATVLPLFDAPDGYNINEACGATDTRSLAKVVLDLELNLGIAFDGDGDRVSMRDEHGREVGGDQLMYINGVYRRVPGVVATVMSNMGLEIALGHRGIDLHRTDVGDRSVLAGMDQRGLDLGGEQSGHIIIKSLSPTGDGILAAIQTLRAVRYSEKPLSEWHDEVKIVPQALVNVPVADKAAVMRDPRVRELAEQLNERLAGEGRGLLRPSGTEDLVRVMVEAPNASELAAEMAERIAAIAAA